MDQEQWKERSIRKKAIHQGARVRDGSRKNSGSNGSGSNKGAMDVTSDVSGRKRWIREQ